MAFDKIILGRICFVLALINMLPKGSLKSVEILKVKLEFYPIEPNIFNLITESPEWIRSTLNIKEIDTSQIPLYFKLNLKNTLTLTSPFNRNKKVFISNLEDFEKYRKLGYYGGTTIDISLESQYLTLLVFFRLLQNCKSVIPTSTDTLDRIIPTIRADKLPYMLDENNEDKMMIHKDDSIKEYLSTGIYEVNSQNKYFEIVRKYQESYESEIWSFWEVQRADFFNSGCEEIFMLCHYHSAGTLNFYYPLVIRHISGRYDTVDISHPIYIMEKIVNFMTFVFFRLKLRILSKIKNRK